MVKLLVGNKGTGKTKQMVDMANDSLGKVNGSVVFINKNSRLTYDLNYRIRVICMDDYEQVTNTEQYIGFILGIISQDHDIETIYIDSILKHADVTIADLPMFLERLAAASEKFGPDFVVSLSASREDLGDTLAKYEVLN